MKRKELTKPFMMISNWLKLFGLHDFWKINSALWGLVKVLITSLAFLFVLQTRNFDGQIGIEFERLYVLYTIVNIFISITWPK